MSPVASHRITLGQGGEQHDAADAVLAGFLVKRFEGRVAIVTGAGSGIGRGTARRLASEGAAVAAIDVVGDAVADTVAGITADGGRAVAYTCDVTSEESVTSTVASVVTDLGPPTVVCNVAGIGGFFNSHEMPFDRWQKILAVNLTGPFLVCRAALPHLLEHIRKGRIDAKGLITHRFPLQETPEAYRLFASRKNGVMKCVLIPPGEG